MKLILSVVFLLFMSVQVFAHTMDGKEIKASCDINTKRPLPYRKSMHLDWKRVCYRLAIRLNLSASKIEVCGDDRVSRNQAGFERCLRIVAKYKIITNDSLIECGIQTTKIGQFEMCVKTVDEFELQLVTWIRWCGDKTENFADFLFCLTDG